MLYPREIKDKIARLCGFFPVLVLTGARQSGKTTLLRGLFPTFTYVSLDLPSDAQMAEDSPEEFFRRFPLPIIIDEVQYAPKLFRYIKIIVDRDRERAGAIILTGSQKFTLMKEVSDSLAGRAAILDLENLSAHELGETFQVYIKDHGVQAALTRGFYPQLWKSLDFPASDFYRSYLATYIERDVRQLINIGSIRDFDRFMRVCAARSGNLLNKSELAKDVGITPKTANEWLSVLCASNQVSLLEPYFQNIGKRIVKSPKLYFNDTGLLCFLLGLNASNVASTPLIGAIWETFIYAELRKYLPLTNPECALWFYRDQTREIDFLIPSGSRINMLECKWSENPSARDFVSMQVIGKQFSEFDVRTFVVSRSNATTLGQGLNTLNGCRLRPASFLG